MTHAMEEKIGMIDEYIDALKQAKSNNDVAYAKSLQSEIILTYDQEIQNLRNGLDNYSIASLYNGNRTVDFIADAELLISKLRNYKLNLKAGLVKSFNDANGAIQVTQTVQQDVKNTITISLEQAIINVNSLPSSILADKDKEILCGKLAALSVEKSKESKWEKSRDVLRWVADKSVDVGIAALPFILQAISSAPI